MNLGSFRRRAQDLIGWLPIVTVSRWTAYLRDNAAPSCRELGRATLLQKCASDGCCTGWVTGIGYTLGLCPVSQIWYSPGGISYYSCMGATGTDIQVVRGRSCRNPVSNSGIESSLLPALGTLGYSTNLRPTDGKS